MNEMHHQQLSLHLIQIPPPLILVIQIVVTVQLQLRHPLDDHCHLLHKYLELICLILEA
jgi:hypothetical protein